MNSPPQWFKFEKPISLKQMTNRIPATRQGISNNHSNHNRYEYLA